MPIKNGKKPAKTTIKRVKSLSIKDKLLDYCQKVLNDEILSCKWVKLACKRFINDFENPKIHFDEKVAQDVIDFFKLTPHVKGEWAGQPIILELWQQFIIANIFGWKKQDGTRRFRTVYLECARKNSKSTMLAVMGLYLMRFDNEPGSEVFSAATTRDQAKVVWDIAQRMVKTSQLRRYITPFKNNLHCEDTGSKFEPLSSDYNSLDGLNIHAGLIDELHAHKTNDLYQVIDTATGSRRQPLIIAITTAGYDRHSVCWNQHAYTEKVLENVINDDTFFGMVYTLDTEDDWEDETCWIKANPNLNISVKLDDLKRKAKKAKEMPSELNSFLRKHMNLWTESVTRWISTDKWNACNFPINENELIGMPCYAGLDLSSTTDITAFVLVFPPDMDDKYKILCRFFIPSENMRERVRRDRVPYDVWVRQGYIYTTPGNVIDYSFVLHQINEDAQKFDLREIAFDRWGATKIVQDLQELGFERPQDNKHAARNVIDFGQGFASMNSPTKELEKMILSQEIAHGGNPVLKWMASNVVVKIDPAGNLKPDKGQSTEKIDGIVSLIMAIDRAVRHQEDGEPSISLI